MAKGNGTMEEIKTEKGYLHYRIWSDENLEITDIFIEPDFRRQGEGRKMVQEIEKIVREKELACIYLFTRKSNKEAQEFYRVLGFEKVYDIQGFYRSENGIMYIKRYG